MHYISTNLNENTKRKSDQDLIPKEISVYPHDFADNKNSSNKKKTDIYQQNREDNDPPINNGRSVFIGNLNFKVTEKELKDFFSKIGIVEYVKIPIKNGKPMGVAFVNFETPQSALEAIKIYNEKDLLGRKAYMRLASEHHKFVPFIPSKKSQNQHFHYRDEQCQQNHSEKYERSKRYHMGDRRSRIANYEYRSSAQYDYDYDYYNYSYDYDEYDDYHKHSNGDYDRRRLKEVHIDQYQRRNERVMYLPRQFENANIYGEPYYISPHIKTTGPNYY